MGIGRGQEKGDWEMGVIENGKGEGERMKRRRGVTKG